MSLFGGLEHQTGPVGTADGGWLFAYEALVIIPHLYYSESRFVRGTSTARPGYRIWAHTQPIWAHTQVRPYPPHFVGADLRVCPIRRGSAADGPGRLSPRE